MQGRTYLQAFYEKVSRIDEECKKAVEEIARIDLLLMLFEMAGKKARNETVASK